MSFLVEKKVGETVYLYEATSSWDAQKKQPRQTRRYLGKKSPNSDTVIPPRRSTVPRQAKDYGNSYVLQQLAARSGVTAVLRHVFPEDAPLLLALALFEIAEGAPLYLFPYWIETTAMEPVKALSPAELTTLTQRLGRMEREREAFFQQWIAHCSPVHTIVFDITSVSSYSTLINEVEWGYNRDHDRLPQVNLGVVYAEQAHLPLYYQLYPGSIHDVSTLSNMLQYLEALALTPSLFVMDRGFYSSDNLPAMIDHSMKFLIPLPRTVTLFADLLAQHQQTLTALPNSFLFDNALLCHVQTAILHNMTPVYAHLFFDPASHADQTQRFLTQLWQAETALHQQPFRSPQDAEHAVTTALKGAAAFFRFTQTGERVDISRDFLALTRRLAPMGATILLTNQPDLERTQVLRFYRQKDFLEKTFDTLKHDCDGQRLRGHSMEAVTGRIFLKFLSLIVHSVLINAMRTEDLLTEYSVRELLCELKKIRMVEMSNGKQVLTEISKRQKDIFKALGLKPPILKT